MDRDEEKGAGVEKWYLLAKKTLRLVGLLSLSSFLYCYFSGLSYNLHFSTFILSLSAHAMDRKYMFLVCNAILAFLVNNLSFNSSIKISDHQVAQMPATLLQQNVATVEYGVISLVAGEEQAELQRECDHQPVDQEIKEEDKLEEEEEEDDDVAEQGSSAVEEVSDASLSTEELNQKFQEFIRKMKEEIRIGTHSFS